MTYLRNWLKRELRNIIRKYIDEFSSELNISHNKIFIKTQKTKWGSCSPQNNLSFNFKLILLPIPLIKYVVLHEIVHLKVSSHNNVFWDIIEKYMPDYKEKEYVLLKYSFIINKNNFENILTY